MELIFADLETLEKRLSKVKHLMNNDKEAKVENEVLENLKKHLEEGHPVITFERSEDDEKYVNDLNLLTDKKVIYACNVSEEDIANDGANNEQVKKVREYAKQHNFETFVLCAKVEEDLAGLEDAEKEEFLKELGLKESGLDKLVAASYRLLNLMSFLTAGEKETRAWTITIGTKAPQAAGKIHTDFEKGFIRAEIISPSDWLELGGEVAVKEAGKMRTVGRDYIMQDGDICHFLFNN
jgi:GTP-binding protein YchF